jgi:predicted phage-related endonuclease
VKLTRGWTVRNDWKVATPDFLVIDGDTGIVETKLVGARMLHHWPEDDRGVVRAPDEVVAQVQWQQHVTGARQAEIAVLLGGTDFRIVACHYSLEIAASLEEIGGRFWRDHVLARVPPKPDASGSYAAYLAQSWPSELKPQIAAPAEATEIAERYEAAHKSMKRAEAEKQQAANELKALIGDTAGLRAQLWQARWSPIDECVVQTYTRKAHRRFSLTTYKGFGQ